MRIARNYNNLTAGLGALLVSAAPALALAQTNAQALLNDPFRFSLGGFIVNSDVKANLNGSSSQNAEIDFDKTFGNDKDATRFRGDALWRITPTHHLVLSAFTNRRKASKTLDQAIDWGDYHFTGEVNSETNMDIIALSYEYAFMRAPDYEIAASIGVHYSKLSLGISGNASITDGNGNVTAVPSASRSESVPAPLPVIGLRGGWAVAPEWYLEASAQLFKVKVGDVDGNWSDLRGSATWMFSRHWGAGLGYNRFYNRVDVDKAHFDGKLKYGYQGLQLFLTGSY